MASKKEGKGIINWRITIIILFIVFVQNLIQALLYADSPFLIESYFPGVVYIAIFDKQIDNKRIGHYSGYLISLYNLGQIPGCLYWGWHADRFGRKPALIIITLSIYLFILALYVVNSILMIAFGFTTNFAVAITIRFIWGVADGYLGICKTILSEICSEDMLPVTTGCMFISMALSKYYYDILYDCSALGPIVGGYLSDPEKLLSSLIDRFPILKKAPFAIPLAVCGLLCFLCMILTMIIMQVVS